MEIKNVRCYWETCPLFDKKPHSSGDSICAICKHWKEHFDQSQTGDCLKDVITSKIEFALKKAKEGADIRELYADPKLGRISLYQSDFNAGLDRFVIFRAEGKTLILLPDGDGYKVVGVIE